MHYLTYYKIILFTVFLFLPSCSLPVRLADNIGAIHENCFAKGKNENSSDKFSTYITCFNKNIDEFDENLIAHYLKNDYIDTTKKINTSSPIEINSNQPSEIEHDKNDLDLFENVNKEDILKYLETEGITIEELEESVKG